MITKFFHKHLCQHCVDARDMGSWLSWSCSPGAQITHEYAGTKMGPGCERNKEGSQTPSSG